MSDTSDSTNDAMPEPTEGDDEAMERDDEPMADEAGARPSGMPDDDMNTTEDGMAADGPMPGEDEKRAREDGGMEESDTGEMPTGGMAGSADEGTREAGGMPTGEMETEEMERRAGDEGEDEVEEVLVELYVPDDEDADSFQPFEAARAFDVPSFHVHEYSEAVPMEEPAEDEPAEATAGRDAGGRKTVVVAGTVKRSERSKLASNPEVKEVFDNAEIQLYETVSPEAEDFLLLEQANVLPEDHVFEEETFVESAAEGTTGTCPIPECDCQSSVPKGTIADVAQYLGADDIWSQGYRGQDIRVGVVDAGTHAVESGGDISNVVDGWPSDGWGTATPHSKHGHMSATDVLGMAPETRLYDLRIFMPDRPNVIGNALEAFQWAIDRHRDDGTPHVLTNSWGPITKDSDYSVNPNHPFTRKVEEAMNEDILVLFAAGNCGETCPSGKCHPSAIGPGNSILGANGHRDVMTVGAANLDEEFVGYSSQGPATLEEKKPDFCSITHFTGYFHSDNGTSAATPIAAGVVSLFKQANPSLTQADAKRALTETAKDIGPSGWDQHSGAGIIQGGEAFEEAVGGQWSEWSGLGGVCLHGVDAASWAENRLDAFVVGTNSELHHKWWDGSQWRGWESLGGTCVSEPAAVSWGPNRIDAFVIGTDNQLYHKWWDGGQWRGYEGLGGRCTYGVDVSSWAENRLDAFVIGTDNQLYHKWWDGSQWRGWESLGGTCVSEPAAVSWGSNRIDAFVIGTDNQLYHKWWDGSQWRGYESLGGRCIRGVAASSRRENQLDVFVVGTNNQMYQKTWNGRSWGDWESLGGICTSAPAAVSWGSNRIDAFVLGTDSQLWQKYYE